MTHTGWRQIFADVFDREIRQVADPIQSNARGAAFIAGVALGDITFDEIRLIGRILSGLPCDWRRV